ncbi:substrate-binding domain-containing protein [Candidatus Bathyarchaeota archaeon]|nr:substrate-binding domain-containing protein [Candidatus Bathyarchaeota archaeon]
MSTSARKAIELPPELQIHRSTVAGMISYTSNTELSRKLIDFLTSNEARKIYSDYGWFHSK